MILMRDSLQFEVAMRTGAEVLGVIQTNHLARTANAGDARQVAGGPTLIALLLLIWEHLVINLLRLRHTLGDTNSETFEPQGRQLKCHI